MILYYMETSALLKRYRTEPGSDVIVELLERRRPDETFITSYFTLLEVEATAARALKARLLDQDAYGPSWVTLRWMLAGFSCFIQLLTIRYVKPLRLPVVMPCGVQMRSTSLR